MPICNNYCWTWFAGFFKLTIELSCCFLYCNNREASQKQNQMTEIGKTRPKSIDYQRKSCQNVAHSLEKDSLLTSHQQPQKLLYRNRSLKHFFGEIKGLNADILHCRLDQCNRKKKNQPLPGRHPDKRCTPNRGKKIGEAVQNQYLVIHKSRRPKIAEQKVNTKKIQRIQYSNSLRGSKKLEAQKNQENHKACNKGVSFYDPNVYNWRKSSSKDKNGQNFINETQMNEMNGPKMTHSQYYTTTNSSRKQPSKLQKQEYQPIRKQNKPKLTLSSCSIQGRKDSLLKPKVTKNVFSPRSPKFKQPDTTSNKVLLFTFGHI